ncbi:sensor histidine kinase [Streptomyces sp. TLI_146]|uniref:sensor histidine kinase n=1 Tax=Streptomyces sp. TLI_146 TaxID=1938858 RepID=UPI000C708EB5|nr:histidine kinase [Streptomyces sp. TLI_146]PKV83018.1 signal transduction histidine kinase [Streptomyces sp. TLI_146]
MTLTAAQRRLLYLLGPVVLGVGDTFIGAPGLNSLERTLSVLAGVVLIARLRMPVVTLLLTLPGQFMGSAWLAGLIALYTVSRLKPSRLLLTACALLTMAVMFLPYPMEAAELHDRATDWAWVESSLAAPIAAVALGRAVALRGELAVRLRELTEGRSREDRLLAEQVLATERTQLAREMHDVVAHQVSLISLQAGALRMSSVDPVARETADTIRTLAVRTLDELRHMVGVLRAGGAGSVERRPQPRLSDLPRLIAESALEVDADICDQACASCPEGVERAAFRIVQEALTNVRKHAPGSKVRVSLRCEGNELRVEIRNAAPAPGAAPLDLPSGGHGLIGLSERVHLLGGFLSAGPDGAGGFVVRATLPVGSGLAGGTV